MTPETTAILALNQANVPHVGSISPDELELLLDWSDFQYLEWSGDSLVGFILGLLPGKPYSSRNYRWFNEDFPELAWFSENEASFLYIDRLAVSDEFRRQGVGGRFYEKARQYCVDNGLNQICCEVNLEPPNLASHAFHQGLGFREVATMKHGPGKTVSMYVWELD